MFGDKYDATVNKHRVFDRDRVWLWIRHIERGEPGHKNITLCGTDTDGCLAFYRVNQADVDANAQEPPLTGIPLSGESAQSLMDDMWRLGVRPSNDEGNEGALSATKGHLEDMRRITFEYLGYVALERMKKE